MQSPLPFLNLDMNACFCKMVLTANLFCFQPKLWVPLDKSDELLEPIFLKNSLETGRIVELRYDCLKLTWNIGKGVG